MADTFFELCNTEREGASVLGDLLLMPCTNIPSLPDVNRKDLIAVAVWYIWWERRRFTHGEMLQKPARSAQAIATLTKKFARAKKMGYRPDQKTWMEETTERFCQTQR